MSRPAHDMGFPDMAPPDPADIAAQQAVQVDTAASPAVMREAGTDTEPDLAGAREAFSADAVVGDEFSRQPSEGAPQSQPQPPDFTPEGVEPSEAYLAQIPEVGADGQPIPRSQRRVWALANERRAAQEEAAQLRAHVQQLDGRFNQMMQYLANPPQEQGDGTVEVPDINDDPAGHIAALEHNNSVRYQALERRFEESQQINQQMHQQLAVDNHLAVSEAQFERQVPAYRQAKEGLRKAREAAYTQQLGYSQQQAQQAVQQEERTITMAALANGRDPAQALWAFVQPYAPPPQSLPANRQPLQQVAVQPQPAMGPPMVPQPQMVPGVMPQQPQPGVQPPIMMVPQYPQPAPQQLPASLGSNGGGSPPSGAEMTLERLGDLPEGEFRKWLPRIAELHAKAGLM